MCKVGNAGHLDFDGDGNLALDLFGAAAGPLGDDLDVVIGDVRIGFDGQVAKRNMPQPVSTTTPPRTSQRFLRAKSTRARIIYSVPRSFKQQSIGNNLLARFNTGENLPGGCR